MKKPFFWIWMGIVLGIFLSAWPGDYALWLALAAMLWFGRAHLVLLAPAVFLGLVRGGILFLSLSSSVDHLPHHLKLRVVEREVFGAKAQIQERDGSPMNRDEFVNISGNFLIGETLVGSGVIHSLSSLEYRHRIPKERLRIASGHLGRVKWLSPPSILGRELSIREFAREKIFEILQGLAEPLGGFLRAMLIGETSGLSPKIWSSMNYLGLSHALVISGSHLTFFVLILGYFGLQLGRRLRWRSQIIFRGLIILGVGAFFGVCNQDSSLVRAFMGFLLATGLSLLFPSIHRYPRTEQLAWVGIVVLVVSPLATFSASYALSFAATLALFRAFEVEARWLSFYPYFLVVPVCYLFGFILHPLSPLLNLLLLPPLFLILLPISLASLVSDHLSYSANNLVTLYFDSVVGLSDVLQKFTPLAHLPSRWAFLLLVGAVILLVAEMAEVRRRTFLCLLVFGFQCLCWVSWPCDTSQSLRLHVLDMGQGDGFVLEVEGKVFFIDGGGFFEGSNQLFPTVLSEFHNQIDYWVLSHFDQDHIGNFRDILAQVRPGEIWAPKLDRSSFSAELEASSIRLASEGDLGFCMRRYCVQTWVDRQRRLRSKVSNEESMALFVSEKSTKRVVALFLGDLFKAGEERLLASLKRGSYNLDSLSILKVAHHGSKTSSSEGLMHSLRPRFSVITAGRNNSYHHPHPEVLEMIEEVQSGTLRIDAIGNFKLLFDI